MWNYKDSNILLFLLPLTSDSRYDVVVGSSCFFFPLYSSLFWGPPPSSQINIQRLIFIYECLALAWLVSSQFKFFLNLNNTTYLLPLGFYLSLFYMSFFTFYSIVGWVASSLPSPFSLFPLSLIYFLFLPAPPISLSCIVIDCSTLY